MEAKGDESRWWMVWSRLYRRGGRGEGTPRSVERSSHFALDELAERGGSGDKPSKEAYLRLQAIEMVNSEV